MKRSEIRGLEWYIHGFRYASSRLKNLRFNILRISLNRTHRTLRAEKGDEGSSDNLETIHKAGSKIKTVRGTGIDKHPQHYGNQNGFKH